jgi:hypothetical protein
MEIIKKLELATQLRRDIGMRDRDAHETRRTDPRGCGG